MLRGCYPDYCVFIVKFESRQILLIFKIALAKSLYFHKSLELAPHFLKKKKKNQACLDLNSNGIEFTDRRINTRIDRILELKIEGLILELIL